MTVTITDLKVAWIRFKLWQSKRRLERIKAAARRAGWYRDGDENWILAHREKGGSA